MGRILVPRKTICGNTVIIKGSEAHRIANVLRKKAGDVIELFDGSGRQYRAKIALINNGNSKSIEAIITEEKRVPVADTAIKISLYQCIPKGEKMDWVVQKCTELGIYDITPVISDRTVVRPDPAGLAKKIRRWERIAVQASEQSGRSTAPAINRAEGFGSLLERTGGLSGRVMLWESETGLHLGEYLKKQKGNLMDIGLMIGPEGGFSREEAERAEKSGFVRVTVGKRILRTETAGLIAAAIIMYNAGEIG